jgi:hypothetical protein
MILIDRPNQQLDPGVPTVPQLVPMDMAEWISWSSGEQATHLATRSAKSWRRTIVIGILGLAAVIGLSEGAIAKFTPKPNLPPCCTGGSGTR